MLVMNKPNCHNYDKCGNEAMCLTNGMWLCGECMLLIQAKLRKLKQQLLLEE